MFKSTKLIMAAVMVCFAVMAVNSGNVFAEGKPHKILKKLDNIQKTLDNQVIPKLDACCGGVPKTGQTTCYNNEGEEIDCAGTGQDGEYQKGIASPYPRFIDHEDGTVTDNLTGLMWLQNIDLLGGMYWLDAVDTCNSLDFAGYQDWRLPNAKEILTLTDYSQYAPRMPTGHPFIVDSSKNWIWTSTTCPERPYRAETMSLQFGDIGSEPKIYLYKCWCCRGGQ